MSGCEFGQELKESIRREIDVVKDLHLQDIGEIRENINNIHDRLWKIMVGIAATCAFQLITLILWAVFKK